MNRLVFNCIKVVHRKGVQMSMNGTAHLIFDDLRHMESAIKEASLVIGDLDRKTIEEEE